MQVLAIIDDNYDFRLLASKFLSKFNHNLLIKCYSHPSNFLVEYYQNPDDFDLILSDYEMDSFNGLELLAKIRQKSNIPFFLITAKCELNFKLEAVKLGVDFCIEKKNNLKSLFSELNDLITKLNHEIVC